MTIRLKHLTRFRGTCSSSRKRPYVALEHVESWTGKLIEGFELPVLSPTSSGMATAEPGDVLFGKLRPYLAKSWVVDRPVLASTELMCIRPEVSLDSRFLGYIVSTTPFVEWASETSYGIRMPRTSWEKISEYRPWIPSRGEQPTIATFLDVETARIDTLIAKKRSLIQLLEEQWNSYIRGLLGSLACPMLPLKRHWRVIDCKHRTPTYVHNGYPVISPGDTIPGRLDLRRAHRFVDQTDFLDLTAGARRPKKGDIIYSRNASIGIASYVDTDVPFCMGQDVCLITSDDMEQLFLMYALNSIGLDQLAVQKIGSTFSRVNVSQILEILVPVPSRAEQQTLSRRLDLAASHRGRACSRLEEQINLLQERRQALITAVITGEMQVLGRGATAASRSSFAQHTQIELVE